VKPKNAQNKLLYSRAHFKLSYVKIFSTEFDKFYKLYCILDSTKEKINQDSFIVKSRLAGQKGLWMFSVLDGHGIDGHHVSKYAKSQLVEEFETSIKILSKRQASVVPNNIKDRLISNDLNSMSENPNEATPAQFRNFGLRQRNSTKDIGKKALRSIDVSNGMTILDVESDSAQVKSNAKYHRSKSMVKRLNSKKSMLKIYS
jgi:hypothetical protein